MKLCFAEQHNAKNAKHVWQVLARHCGGNFEGNQLLDGWMSLSPLCLSMAKDSHVGLATSLYQNLPRLHASQAQFTTMKVLTHLHWKQREFLIDANDEFQIQLKASSMHWRDTEETQTHVKYACVFCFRSGTLSQPLKSDISSVTRGDAMTMMRDDEWRLQSKRR